MLIPQSVKEAKEMARKSWKENNPRLYKGLKESGELESSLQEAAEMTLEAMKEYEKKLLELNYTKDQAGDIAWEVLREEWLLLPAEKNRKEEEEEE